MNKQRKTRKTNEGKPLTERLSFEATWQIVINYPQPAEVPQWRDIDRLKRIEQSLLLRRMDDNNGES